MNETLVDVSLRHKKLIGLLAKKLDVYLPRTLSRKRSALDIVNFIEQEGYKLVTKIDSLEEENKQLRKALAKTVTIWITRDKEGSGDEDTLWIHSKKPELDNHGVWVGHNRTVHIIPPVKCGTKRMIRLDAEDI